MTFSNCFFERYKRIYFLSIKNFLRKNSNSRKEENSKIFSNRLKISIHLLYIFENCENLILFIFSFSLSIRKCYYTFLFLFFHTLDSLSHSPFNLHRKGKKCGRLTLSIFSEKFHPPVLIIRGND